MSLSPGWGLLVLCDVPPHCESCLGLGGSERGAFFGGAGGAKDEKEVYTQPAALVYSHPNTTGGQARPGALLPSGRWASGYRVSGPVPFVSVYFEFSLPEGSTLSGDLPEALILGQEVATPGPPDPEGKVLLQVRSPRGLQSWNLPIQVPAEPAEAASEAMAVLTCSAWPWL